MCFWLEYAKHVDKRSRKLLGRLYNIELARRSVVSYDQRRTGRIWPKGTMHFEWSGHRFGWAGVEREHKRTFWQILSLEAVKAIWDYVCRRFRIVEAENITNVVGSKLPRVSDSISLDACRSERMHDPAAPQPAARIRTGQSSFSHISRIYNFLIIFDKLSYGTPFVSERQRESLEYQPVFIRIVKMMKHWCSQNWSRITQVMSGSHHR